MATLSNTDIARAIHQSMKGGVSAKGVVEFLARKKLLSKSEAILLRLEDIVDEEQNVLKCHIESFKPLTDKEKKEITDSLQKKYSEKKIVIHEKINETLKGGYKIEIGGEMIDLSVAGKLKKLQEHLTKTK